MIIGGMRKGSRIRFMPSGQESVISEIEAPWGPVEEAMAPDAVTVHIKDDFDVGRGELLCSLDGLPRTERTIAAVVCWMDDRSVLREGDVYRIKHITRTGKAKVTGIDARLSIESFKGEIGADFLGLNEIGKVTLKLSTPLAVDDYTLNRVTGSFILVSEATNATVAAGMIGPPRFSFL